METVILEKTIIKLLVFSTIWIFWEIKNLLGPSIVGGFLSVKKMIERLEVSGTWYYHHYHQVGGEGVDSGWIRGTTGCFLGY